MEEIDIVKDHFSQTGIALFESDYSYTPCRDISILHHIALAPILSYPTELLFYDNNNNKVQLNKLPQTTIILE